MGSLSKEAQLQTTGKCRQVVISVLKVHHCRHMCVLSTRSSMGSLDLGKAKPFLDKSPGPAQVSRLLRTYLVGNRGCIPNLAQPQYPIKTVGQWQDLGTMPGTHTGSQWGVLRH